MYIQHYHPLQPDSAQYRSELQQYYHACITQLRDATPASLRYHHVSSPCASLVVSR